MNSLSAASTLVVATGWVILGFIALLEATVIWLMIQGKINLNRLISEPNGDASMSRLQLLIFTFVIGASLFLVIAAKAPPALPDDIPTGVLTLLGISGSTYLVSKGIQFSTPEGTADRPPRVTVQPKEVDTKGLQHPITQQFTVMFDRGSDQRVVWTIDSTPVLGSITPNGVYTGPAQAPAPGTKVVIKAASVADCRATGYAEVLF
jgi:hypothetical protein